MLGNERKVKKIVKQLKTIKTTLDLHTASGDTNNVKYCPDNDNDLPK